MLSTGRSCPWRGFPAGSVGVAGSAGSGPEVAILAGEALATGTAGGGVVATFAAAPPPRSAGDGASGAQSVVRISRAVTRSLGGYPVNGSGSVVTSANGPGWGAAHGSWAVTAPSGTAGGRPGMSAAGVGFAGATGTGAAATIGGGAVGGRAAARPATVPGVTGLSRGAGGPEVVSGDAEPRAGLDGGAEPGGGLADDVGSRGELDADAGSGGGLDGELDRSTVGD